MARPEAFYHPVPWAFSCVEAHLWKSTTRETIGMVSQQPVALPSRQRGTRWPEANATITAPQPQPENENALDPIGVCHLLIPAVFPPSGMEDHSRGWPSLIRPQAHFDGHPRTPSSPNARTLEGCQRRARKPGSRKRPAVSRAVPTRPPIPPSCGRPPAPPPLTSPAHPNAKRPPVAREPLRFLGVLSGGWRSRLGRAVRLLFLDLDRLVAANALEVEHE
jgi:hypothetical protein